MAWGMVSYLGDRVLVRLDNTLNGPGYLHLLQREVRWEGFQVETLSFQQDKAGPIDTSLQMTGWRNMLMLKSGHQTGLICPQLKTCGRSLKMSFIKYAADIREMMFGEKQYKFGILRDLMMSWGICTISYLTEFRS